MKLVSQWYPQGGSQPHSFHVYGFPGQEMSPVIAIDNSSGNGSVRLESDLSGLSDGSYVFSAKAVDATGNWISDSSAPCEVQIVSAPAVPQLSTE